MHRPIAPKWVYRAQGVGRDRNRLMYEMNIYRAQRVGRGRNAAIAGIAAIAPIAPNRAQRDGAR